MSSVAGAMQAGKILNVEVPYNNNGTGCFKDQNNFSFQVKFGDAKRVVFFLQGGGACWDATTCGFSLAGNNLYTDVSFNPAAVSEGGIFGTAASNPFRDWTIIHVWYCSGDVHSGSSSKDGLIFRGQANVQYAWNWLKAHLPQVPEQLLLSGCSAGSMGAALWADRLLSDAHAWGVAKGAVFLDSFLGAAPAGFTGLKNWGTCNSLNADLKARCETNGVSTADVVHDLIKKHPVSVGHFNHDMDLTQAFFYNVMKPTTTVASLTADFVAMATHDATAAAGWLGAWMPAFRGLLNELVSVPANAVGRYAHYLGSGMDHCITNADSVLQYNDAAQPLLQWVMDAFSPAPWHSQCYRALQGQCPGVEAQCQQNVQMVPGYFYVPQLNVMVSDRCMPHLGDNCAIPDYKAPGPNGQQLNLWERRKGRDPSVTECTSS